MKVVAALVLYGILLALATSLLICGLALVTWGFTYGEPWKALLGGVLLLIFAAWCYFTMRGVGKDNIGA